ncbi:MAG: hypothetical protein R2851_20565 [Caldilineaceae bacterium]
MLACAAHQLAPRVGDTLWFTRTVADGVTHELVRQSPGGQVVTSLPAHPADQVALVDHAGRLWTTDGMTVCG